MLCERKTIMWINHGVILFSLCIYQWDIQNIMTPFIDNSLRSWPLEWLELVMEKESMLKENWYQFKEMQFVFLRGMTFLEFEARFNNFNSAILTLTCYMHWIVVSSFQKWSAAQNISNGVRIFCKPEVIGFYNKL